MVIEILTCPYHGNHVEVFYLIVNVEIIFSSTGVTVINNLEFKMHIFTLNVELIIELYAPYVRAPLSRLFFDWVQMALIGYFPGFSW